MVLDPSVWQTSVYHSLQTIKYGGPQKHKTKYKKNHNVALKVSMLTNINVSLYNKSDNTFEFQFLAMLAVWFMNAKVKTKDITTGATVLSIYCK